MSNVALSDETIVHVRKCPTTGVDIELCYVTCGAPSDSAVLLIPGLGGHLGMYDPTFIAELAGRGFFVIAMDNRDIGRSTKLDGCGSPPMWTNLFPQWLTFGYGKPVYALQDMADDAWALLDAIAVRRAYLLGVSMGGMIAQTMAVSCPERTLGLISIMSSTGSPQSEPASVWTTRHLLKAPKSTAIDDMLAFRLDLAVHMLLPEGGGNDPAVLEYVKQRALKQLTRSTYRDGGGRMVCAITRALCRESALEERLAAVPALIIHGNRDRLVPFSNGVRTARCLKRCRFAVMEGQGHYLLTENWLWIAQLVAELRDRPPTGPADNLARW